MNREIKFRAWTNAWDEMVMPDDSEKYIDIHSKTIWHDSRDTHGELMQFTGIKDRNGTEIYEGDIVKQSGHWICVVEHIPDRWALNVHNHKKYKPGTKYHNFFSGVDWHRNQDKKVEVIGNIFENPELLENE